jgi:MFS family permease
MRQLLARRDARIYLTGQVFSLFGDSCLWLAMGVWVRELTGSNAQAGLVFFFYTAPSLLAPAFGLLADRVKRRNLLLAANTLTAAAVLALLAVHGPGQVWLIDAVMFAYGVSAQVMGPAQSALLTVIVPVELLADANAAFRTVQEGLRLVGPLAGAALFVAAGPHVIAVIDAATFTFPVVSLLLLRVREPAPHPAEGHWASQVAAGVRHIWQAAELRQIVIAGACTTTVFGFTETTIYAIVSDGLHRPPAFIGVTGAVQGIGALAGGLTAAPLVRKAGEGRLAGLAMLTAAVGVALTILPLLPSVIAGLAVFGAAIPWLVIALMTLAQRLTPPQLQGRVFAAVEVLITTPQTLSIALGAALITVVGYQVLLAAMAAVFAAAAVSVLTRPEQRRYREGGLRWPRPGRPPAGPPGGPGWTRRPWSRPTAQRTPPWAAAERRPGR